LRSSSAVNMLEADFRGSSKLVNRVAPEEVTANARLMMSGEHSEDAVDPGARSLRSGRVPRRQSCFKEVVGPVSVSDRLRTIYGVGDGVLGR
jgi:hypothetical protein